MLRRYTLLASIRSMVEDQLIASYLADRLGAERAREISLVIAGRGLIGMVVLLCLSQEVLGMGRFLPVDAEQIPATIAEVFLHGVTGRAPGRTT